MNADSFCHFYNYHFSENRKLWDNCVSQLTDEQFTHPVDYSHGSVRDQIIHLIGAEEMWFSELRGVEPLEPSPEPGVSRDWIRAHWDNVEKRMREYLAALRDEMLFAKPILEPEEDRNLVVWQVLLHVVNHATDHRAQILRLLNDLGVKTSWQDYIFYAYENQ